MYFKIKCTLQNSRGLNMDFAQNALRFSILFISINPPQSKHMTGILHELHHLQFGYSSYNLAGALRKKQAKVRKMTKWWTSHLQKILNLKIHMGPENA